MRLSALLLLLVLLAGCQPPAGPALVQVQGVAAARLREGDVLELRGDAFPEGKVAEVTLRGEVSRAGQPRLRRFELSIPGRSVSTHAIAVDVTRLVQRALTGTSEPGHATFRGAIDVSFPPRLAHTPPVTGTLADVTLDFIPAEGDAALHAMRREAGEKFVEFVGVLLEEEQSVPTVAGVMPGSAAERAGVARGDRLLELAGVHVLSLEDCVPPPRAQKAELVVERADSAEPKRLALEVKGFHPLSPGELGLAAGLVAGALVLLVVLASPIGRALSFVEHRLSARRRLLATPAPRLHPGPRPGLVARFGSALPARPSAYVVFVLASSLLAATALGIPLVARELDLPALLVLAFTASVTSSCVFGAPGERRLGARLRRAVLALALALPALGALACLACTVGSFGLEALALAQGAAPWQWLAFKSPLLLAAALLLLAALVPEASRGRSLETVLDAPPRARERAVSAATLTDQAALLLGSGVAALAFFGGPRLPGVAFALVPSLGAALAGVAVLLAKTWLVAGLVGGLRRALGRVDIDEARGPLLKLALPLTAVLVTLASLARQAPVARVLSLGDRGIAWATLAGWLTLALLLARRVAPGRELVPGERGPNPWI